MRHTSHGRHMLWKDTVVPREEHLSCQQLSHDTANRPDVGCKGVQVGWLHNTELTYTFLIVVHPVEHNFWSSPKPSHNIACHFFSKLATQTEVQNLYVAVLTDSNVARFQVLNTTALSKTVSANRPLTR